MVVDGRGHAYVGNFGFDMYGGAKPRKKNVVHVTPDGTVSSAAERLLSSVLATLAKVSSLVASTGMQIFSQTA